MTTSDKSSDKEWQRKTASDKKWLRAIANDNQWQWMTGSSTTNENEKEQIK